MKFICLGYIEESKLHSLPEEEGRRLMNEGAFCCWKPVIGNMRSL